EGVTFTLYNKLSTNCLHCGSEELGGAPGWAYVSSCGNICFHVSCLMDFILDECKNSSNTEQTGPSQTVETQSVADANRGQQVVILREKKNSSIGKVVPVLNAHRSLSTKSGRLNNDVMRILNCDNHLSSHLKLFRCRSKVGKATVKKLAGCFPTAIVSDRSPRSVLCQPACEFLPMIDEVYGILIKKTESMPK
ncbi:hypothetical protein Tco_1099496, partial [Tanacetum coccineum]